jgi:hypothetical protein
MAHHPENLGPTRVFNLMYRGGHDERYLSLLEDDNWWGPDFLSTMVREMDARPAVQVGWANMRIWREHPDGTWGDTGQHFWAVPPGANPAVLLDWPHPRHAKGTQLHSQGAMLVRNERVHDLIVPEPMPCNYVEPLRERRFRFPILLVQTPLAHFAWTLGTARTSNRLEWNRYQAVLLASYLAHVRPPPDGCRQLLGAARCLARPDTARFITAGLIDRRCRYVLRYVRPIDWFRYARGFVRRPVEAVRLLRAKSALPQVWAFLDRATAERQRDRTAAPRPPAGGPVPSPNF